MPNVERALESELEVVVAASLAGDSCFERGL